MLKRILAQIVCLVFVGASLLFTPVNLSVAGAISAANQAGSTKMISSPIRMGENHTSTISTVAMDTYKAPDSDPQMLDVKDPDSREKKISAANDSENLAKAESEAMAAFNEAEVRLDSMKRAYQSWAIPRQDRLAKNVKNAKKFGVKADGVTDDTAKIQDLLNTVPEGSTVFFPAGKYKVNGPIIFAKGITILGEPGTVFDCSSATSTVFLINREGSAASVISNLKISGIEFAGPGVESDPTLMDIFYAKNSKLTYLKIHDFGTAAIRLAYCEDCSIEKCVFDNIFKTALGYGVDILNACNNIYIKYNFFVRNGRHGVSTGCFESTPAMDQYPRKIFINNNYFENTTEEAINTHASTAGPIIITNNVIYNCNKGIQLRNGETQISGNVLVKCNMGIVMRGDGGAYISSNVPHVIKNNIIKDNRWEGVYLNSENVQVLGNIIDHGAIVCLSTSAYVVKDNFIQYVASPIDIPERGQAVVVENNVAKDSNGLRYI